MRLLKCAKCGKPMSKAYTLINGLPVGPECAKSLGLMAPKVKRKQSIANLGAKVVQINDGQGGLF